MSDNLKDLHTTRTLQKTYPEKSQILYVDIFITELNVHIGLNFTVHKIFHLQ